MKKTLLILTSLLIIILFSCICVHAATSVVTVDYATYELSEFGYATLRRVWLEGDTGVDIIIPEEVNGYPVTHIKENAFENLGAYNSPVCNITLPATITNVGMEAFTNCHAKTITFLGNNNVSFGTYAFSEATIDRLVLPGEIKKISDYCFYECTLNEKLTIPGTVTDIGKSAFYNSDCLDLNLTIPANVKKIGNTAFCKNDFTSISVLGDLTSLGNGAFALNYTLKTVDFRGILNKIPQECFNECYEMESINLPKDLETIGGAAFRRCYALKQVDLPDTLTTLEELTGHGCFEGCTSLTKIVIPRSVTKIPKYCFVDCKGVTEFVIHDGVTYIGDWAFSGTGIKEIDLPESVTYFGKITSCYNLERIVIPDKITELKTDQFFKCTALKEVILPEGLTSIGSYAFEDCTSLTELKIPSTVTTIDSKAFYICSIKSIIFADGFTDLPYINFPDTTEYIYIPHGVKVIPRCNYGQNLKKIDLPYGLETIEDYAFSNCTALTTVSIPPTVTYIGEWAFGSCTSLKEITIPEGVTVLKEYAFYGCTSLRHIYLPVSLKEIGYNALCGCQSLINITLPEGLVKIGANAFDNSGLESLTIPGSVKEFGSNFASYNTKELIFAEGITDIPLLTYGKFSVVVLPSTVTSIPESTFENCSALVTVKLPSTLKSIGKRAFMGCESLANINIPQGVAEIGDRAFEDCTSLKKITLPSSIISIGEYAFIDCTSLESLILPSNLEELGNAAFYRCKALESVVIPSTLKVIPDTCFGFCTSMKSAIIKSGVQEIGEDAFYSCYQLNLAIPESVISIGDYALYEVDVYYSGTLEQWELIKGNSYFDSVNYHSFLPVSDESSNPPKPGELLIKLGDQVYNLFEKEVALQKNGRLPVSVSYTAEGLSTEIALTQGGGKYVSLRNGVWHKLVPGDVFDEDKPIYLLVVDDFGESTSRKTKLKIFSDVLDVEKPDDGFKIGQEMKFTIPTSVPVLGGTEVGLELKNIPFLIEKENDEKITFMFGIVGCSDDDLKENPSENKKVIDGFIDDFNKCLEEAKNSIAVYNGIKTPFEKIKEGNKALQFAEPEFDILKDVGFEANVLGYAVFENVNGVYVPSEGKLGIEMSFEYTYEGQAAIWVVPVYYEIGGVAECESQLIVSNLDPNGFEPKFSGEVSVTLTAKIGGGLGIVNVATVGARGEADLNMVATTNGEYQKVSLTGSAHFVIKVLGAEVVNLPTPEAEFIIYETGNPDSLIPGVNKKAKLVSAKSGDGIYSTIESDRVYPSEKRKSGETDWLAGEPPLELFAADISNKDVRLLAQNIYCEANPILREVDGTWIMLWLDEDKNRGDFDKNILVYSVYDSTSDTWSQPLAVYDDGTADYYPDFANDWVVWQNASSCIADNSTLSQIAAKGEILASKWNGTGFDSPIMVTNNDVMDTTPVVAADEHGAYVTWVSNSESNILGLGGTSSVMLARLDGQSVNIITLYETSNPITDISVGIHNSKPYAAYILDLDKNHDTLDDREIYVSDVNSTFALTADDIYNGNPTFDGDMLYWYESGKIMRSNVHSRSKELCVENIGTSDMFEVNSNKNGDVAITYIFNDKDSTEIYAKLFHDNSWSNAVKITDFDVDVKNAGVIMNDDGVITASFNVCNYEDNTADLYISTIVPSHDIAVFVDEICFDTIKPGEENELLIYVENVGERSITGFDVEIKSQNLGVSTTVHYDDIIVAGSGINIYVPFYVSESITAGDAQIRVSISDDEYNYENNVTETFIGTLDLVVDDTSIVHKDGLTYVEVVIANTGYQLAQNVEISLMDKDNSVLETKTLGTIGENGYSKAVFFVDTADIDFSEGYTLYNVNVSSSDKELTLSNNTGTVLLKEPKDAVIHELLFAKSIEESKKLSVNANMSNEGYHGKDVNVMFALYDGDDKLVQTYISPEYIPGFSDMSVDGFFDLELMQKGTHYTIKTFVLDGQNILKPLCAQSIMTYLYN